MMPLTPLHGVAWLWLGRYTRLYECAVVQVRMPVGCCIQRPSHMGAARMRFGRTAAAASSRALWLAHSSTPWERLVFTSSMLQVSGVCLMCVCVMAARVVWCKAECHCACLNCNWQETLLAFLQYIGHRMAVSVLLQLQGHGQAQQQPTYARPSAGLVILRWMRVVGSPACVYICLWVHL
jgi:hypothetical protein